MHDEYRLYRKPARIHAAHLRWRRIDAACISRVRSTKPSSNRIGSKMLEFAPLFASAKASFWLTSRGARTRFDVPLVLHGTPFQLARLADACHDSLSRTTISYASCSPSRLVPAQIVRAVAGAVGHNPISIILPCHRVIGSDGSLTGYAGGLERKRALLTWRVLRQNPTQRRRGRGGRREKASQKGMPVKLSLRSRMAPRDRSISLQRHFKHTQRNGLIDFVGIPVGHLGQFLKRLAYISTQRRGAQRPQRTPNGSNYRLAGTT